MPFFELQHQDKTSHARAGVMHTGHGDILTPAFMPVGTQASVKTLDQTDLENLGAPIILGNTYHLHLRPGEDLIAELGGLHKFMNWNKPILTDSGGFQVFSLGLQKKNTPLAPLARGDSPIPPNKEGGRQGDREVLGAQGRLVKIDNDGVTFTSHIDGSVHRFTPESSIDIQHKLGADIIMAFDECTPDDSPLEYAKEAMERTHQWAERSLATHEQNKKYHGYHQYLFGIIQGGPHRNLREESARFISTLDFDGIAIGGESIGYNMEATKEILDWVYPLIPENKPHYAMGVGLSPADLLVAMEHGVDMFDCVAPTRLARHGNAYVSNPKNPRLDLFKSALKKDTRPIDERCSCTTCKNYSRAYLHHLFAAEELTALRLTTIHNLHFMLNLMREARAAILGNHFAEFVKPWFV